MFFDIQMMHIQMATNHLRPKPHPDLHSLAGDQPFARSQIKPHAGYHQAVEIIPALLQLAKPTIVRLAPQL